MIIMLMFYVAVLILLIRNFNSRYAVCLEVSFIGVIIIILFELFYLARFSNYSSIFEFENKIFRIINSVRIDVFLLKKMIVFGIILIMLSFFITAFIIKDNGEIKFLEDFKFYVGLIFVFIFGFLNMPGFSSNIYFMFYEDKKILALRLNDFIKYFDIGVILYYFIFPIITVIRSFIETKLLIIKRSRIIMLCFLICSEAVISLLFLETSVLHILTPLNINNFDIYYEYTNKYFYSQFLVMIILFICIFYLYKYKVFDSENFIVVKRQKKATVLYKDIRPIFHSYKNAMFVISTLQQKALTYYGTPEGKNALERIGVVGREFSDRIGKCLNAYNAKQIDIEKISINDCVKKSIANIVKSNEFHIDVWSDNEYFIMGNTYYLEEMFYNIITNSVDALDKKEFTGKDKGKISVEIFCENKWICVSVCDNGVGISKKNIKKIFRPMFSTKKTIRNYGIGLAYAQNVMTAHSGFINAVSKEGEGTKIQCVFPRVYK